MAFTFNWRGPNIIKEGLIFYYNTNSYYCCTNTPTTVRDISGYNGYNYTSNLINNVTYNNSLGGYLTFDGVDDILLSENFPNQDIKHITVLTKPSTTINSSATGKCLLGLRKSNLGSLQPDSNWYVGLGSLTNQLSNEYITIADLSSPGNKRTGVVDGGSLLANNWYLISLNWNGSNYDIYVNNTQKAVVSSPSGHVPLLTNPDCIFAGARTGDLAPDNIFYGGSYALIMVYNKTLTSSEMLKNYNSLKNKFNL